MRIRTEVPLLTSLTPLPLGQTGSQNDQSHTKTYMLQMGQAPREVTPVLSAVGEEPTRSVAAPKKSGTEREVGLSLHPPSPWG